MTDFAADAAAITYPSPFGDGWVAFVGGEIVELGLPGAPSPFPMVQRDSAAAATLAAELAAYWRGGGLPPAPEAVLNSAGGTPLTEAIYRRVTAIPSGTTMTYADVAAAMGRPLAARAVGAAMAANRFAPMIPCHRLVGSDGSLRGYAGGLEMKRYLIAMEAGADHG